MINCKKTIMAFSFLLMIACSARTHDKGGDKTEGIDLKPEVTAPVFDKDSAYRYVGKQTEFGFRVPNTKAHEATAQWLADELRRHGAQVIVQEAQVTAYDGTLLNAKNIIGSFDADNPERILLFAHWDTRPYADHDPAPANYRKPIMGANDGASGVGVLLEIARLIGKQQPRVGIDIIFFDAEDYGQPEFATSPQQEDSWALGTQYWARKPHIPGYRARYGILLDMVGGKDALFYKEGFSRYYASGINDKVWKTAQRIGYGKYFVDIDGGYITDDHVYVNKMGIQSIDIIQQDPNTETGFCKQWHTLDDTMEHIDAETLKAVGQTVLEVIYNE